MTPGGCVAGGALAPGCSVVGEVNPVVVGKAVALPSFWLGTAVLLPAVLVGRDVGDVVGRRVSRLVGDTVGTRLGGAVGYRSHQGSNGAGKPSSSSSLHFPFLLLLLLPQPDFPSGLRGPVGVCV